MDTQVTSPKVLTTEYFVTIGKGKLKMHPQPKTEEEAIRQVLTMGHNSSTVKLVKEVTYGYGK